MVLVIYSKGRTDRNLTSKLSGARENSEDIKVPVLSDVPVVGNLVNGSINVIKNTGENIGNFFKNWFNKRSLVKRNPMAALTGAVPPLIPKKTTSTSDSNTVYDNHSDRYTNGIRESKGKTNTNTDKRQKDELMALVTE
jgi:hypothetical protein